MTQSFHTTADGRFAQPARVTVMTRALETAVLLLTHGGACSITQIGDAAFSRR